MVLLHFTMCGAGGDGFDCMASRTVGSAGLGALVGGLLGWRFDREHENRETVYVRRSTVTVTPIFARRGAGFGAVIRW